MSDLLVIVGFSDHDDQLVEEIARRRPDRVTVLVERPDHDWATAESDRARATRARLARLLGAIEARTGAAVLGTVGDREQLIGWRFDRIVGERAATTV